MVSPSVQFVLDTWYVYVLQLKALGFTPQQAHALATLKQAYYAGVVTR